MAREKVVTPPSDGWAAVESGLVDGWGSTRAMSWTTMTTGIQQIQMDRRSSCAALGWSQTWWGSIARWLNRTDG